MKKNLQALRINYKMKSISTRTILQNSPKKFSKRNRKF